MRSRVTETDKLIARLKEWAASPAEIETAERLNRIKGDVRQLIEKWESIKTRVGFADRVGG